VTGQPPMVDVDLEKRVQAACRHGIANGWIQSAHDSSEGGLAIALSESCISGGQGAAITLAIASDTDQRWDRVLFGEGGARIVVSVSPSHVPTWEAYLSEHLDGAWEPIGTVGSPDSALSIHTQDGTVLINTSVETMGDRWATAIDRRMAQ